MKEILAILSLFACILLLMCACSPAHAQVALDTPGANICLYHPETIVTSHPAGRQIIVQARPYGWPTSVDSVGYLRQISSIAGSAAAHERAVTAIQYSLAANPSRSETAGQIQLRAYLTTAPVDLTAVPAVTLRDAVRRYLWSGSPQERATYGHWLTLAVNDASNKPCNPWRIY